MRSTKESLKDITFTLSGILVIILFFGLLFTSSSQIESACNELPGLPVCQGR
jgi:hypothetical protein